MKREALGRGLGELLDEVESAYENENSEFVDVVDEIDIDIIDPNPDQPRQLFEIDAIKELSQSIKTHGLLQPIVLIRNDDRYTLVSGERRLRATKLLKSSTIKSIVLNISRDKLNELALIENVQRENLNIVELAHSYDKLIKQHDITHEQLSDKLSKSRSSITNTLRVLSLCDYVQNKLLANSISFGHAKMMTVLDEKQQQIATDSIIAQKLSVQETSKLITQLKNKNEPKQQTPKPKMLFDKAKLQNIVQILKNKSFKATINPKGINITIKNDKDIEKLNTLLS